MKSFFQIAQRVREFVPDAEIRVYLDGPTPTPATDDPQVVYAHRQAVKWCEDQMASDWCDTYHRPAEEADFQHSAIWCYPTHLPQPGDEDAIRMAQLHGAIPVINPIGVLGPRMFGGIPLWGIPAIDPLVRTRYACEIVRILLDAALQERMREQMVQFAVSAENPNVRDSLAIDGWMSPVELDWLATHASQFKSVVEIGCWKGRSTVAMAAACPGVVYAIDHWYGGKDEPIHIKEAAADDKIYHEFMRNIEPFRNIIPIRCSSQEAALTIGLPPSGYNPSAGVDISCDPDMVFIDAGHGYDDVVADIKAWLPRTNVLICGHDYNWTTVAAAVKDTLGSVSNDAGSIWYKWIRDITKENAA